jgi:hypothetical protein
VINDDRVLGGIWPSGRARTAALGYVCADLCETCANLNKWCVLGELGTVWVEVYLPPP